MKEILVELEMPDLDQNNCDHRILEKIVSWEAEEHWQCVFCKIIIKQKRDEVQKKLQK